MEESFSHGVVLEHLIKVPKASSVIRCYSGGHRRIRQGQRVFADTKVGSSRANLPQHGTTISLGVDRRTGFVQASSRRVDRVSCASIEGKIRCATLNIEYHYGNRTVFKR